MTTVAPSNLVDHGVVVGDQGKTRVTREGYSTSVTPRYDAPVIDKLEDLSRALPTAEGVVMNTKTNSSAQQSKDFYQAANLTKASQRPALMVEGLDGDLSPNAGYAQGVTVPAAGVQQVQTTTVKEVTRPLASEHNEMSYNTHKTHNTHTARLGATKARGVLGRFLHFITTNLPLASLLGLMTLMLALQSGMFMHGLRHNHLHHKGQHVHQEVQATNYMVPQMGQTYWAERLQTLQSEMGLLNDRMGSINRELGMARVQLAHCKDDARVIKAGNKKVVKETVSDYEVEA